MSLANPVTTVWSAADVQAYRTERRVRQGVGVMLLLLALGAGVIGAFLLFTRMGEWLLVAPGLGGFQVRIVWGALLPLLAPFWWAAFFAMYGWSVRARRVLDVPEMTEESRVAVEEAVLFAAAAGRAPAGLEITLSLLRSMTGRTFLARLNVVSKQLEESITARAPKGSQLSWQALFADAKTLSGGKESLRSATLLRAAFAREEYLQNIFDANGRNKQDIENTLAWLDVTDELRKRYDAVRRAAHYKPRSGMDRAMTARPTPVLNACSDDVTLAAVYGHTRILVGRGDEMRLLFRAIEGAKSSVVLVGEAGVGKGAMIDGLADLMVEEKVPGPLKDKRLVRLSVSRLSASGDNADERFLAALLEAGRAQNVVLVIEDIHELISVKAAGGLDLGSLLARELEKGYLTVIGTTTPAAYTGVLERHTLGKRFIKVDVNAPNREAAIQVVEGATLYTEGQTGVYFTYGAIAASVDLAMRYVYEGSLPQTALQLAAEAANAAKQAGQTWVTEREVGAVITERTHVPVAAVEEDEAERLLGLEDALHARVIGQEAAVKAVAAALRRARANMRSTKRPIASFLFLGSTGVGKTELAKATAATYYGDENAMIRFDMSEFSAAESSERLIGGAGRGGLLTEAIRKRPFSLLLLDELEKADNEVLNLFLQVMDDGRITDGAGRTIDCTNVIIIATSNAGTAYIQDETAKGTSLPDIKEALLQNELRNVYKPEFLNRFNDVIVFSPLTKEDVVAIAYLLLAGITKRMAEQSINLTVSDEAVHELAEAGFDQKFGARPLRRALEERVENALADAILRGEVARRDTVVYEKGGRLRIEKAAAL